MPVRIILLTSEHPCNVALAHKLRDVCEVAAVVVSANRPPGAGRRRRGKRFANRVAGRLVGRPFISSWFAVQDRYAAAYGREFPAEARLTAVEHVNDQAVLDQIETLGPDLAVVSSTNLVRTPIIRAMSERRGIVNLHTGISPHVKGGPNCTNWCLARGWFHLVGNTVMWLDEGIDSGRLIATERTPLTGGESLADLHWAVLEHSHDLYVRAVGAIARNAAVPSVPQDSVGSGPTFAMADWSAVEMLRARWNFRRGYRRAVAGDRRPVSLVPLDRGGG